MKKLYILSITFLIVSSVFSQAYRPMLSNSSEWYYYTIGLGFQGTTQYSIIGDTTVSNINYSKVYQTSNFNPALLREDSLNKKVYSIQWNNNEALLYDFNLNPGDTFHISPVYGGGFLTLDSVNTNFNSLLPKLQSSCTPDSSNCNINSPKIFYFNNGSIWVEGIGSLSGLLNYKYQNFGCIFSLTCHFDQLGNKDLHFSAWQNQQQGECLTILVNVSPLTNKNSQINISPNPSNSSNILITGKGLNSIKIFNTQGQIVTDVKPIHEETMINLEKQKKGIYFIKAQFTSGGIAIEKLVIN